MSHGESTNFREVLWSGSRAFRRSAVAGDNRHWLERIPGTGAGSHVGERLREQIFRLAQILNPDRYGEEKATEKTGEGHRIPIIMSDPYASIQKTSFVVDFVNGSRNI